MGQTTTSTARRFGRGGFSLLEVLIAMAILSLVMLALYQAYSTVLFQNEYTTRLWRVMNVAQREMLAWERLGRAELSVDQGVYPPGHPLEGYQWRREIADEEPIPGVKLRRVKLEISWEMNARLGPEATDAHRRQRYVTEVYVEAL
ncbi:MAG: prepilin-type N-terminal cleavage/methylation domain-containing protein [Deltaproteobacteria bacterium]|nr:prepilin-type N-terminal cleavage/methylation domain-containing protein [Deltaproteobacteria bacterium]